MKYRPPFHLVQTDLPCARGMGIYYEIGVAASSLDFLRSNCPDHSWAMVCEDGLIDDTKVQRQTFTIIGKSPFVLRPAMAPEKLLKLLRRAA